jgi:hypothetical protein
VEPSAEAAGLRIETFNGELRSARVTASGAVELEYRSSARALAVLNRKSAKVLIDGEEKAPVLLGEQTIALPRGAHQVTIH